MATTRWEPSISSSVSSPIGPSGAILPAFAARQARLVGAHGRQELRDSLTRPGHRLQDGHLDAVGVLAEHLQGPNIPDGHVRALSVRLVDGEDVGDLEDPGLDRLDVITHARNQDDHGGVRDAHHLDLVLTYTDGLDDDLVKAHGVQDPHDVVGRATQPTEVPAGRQASDEHAVIRCVVAHTNPVAEDRAA